MNIKFWRYFRYLLDEKESM